ncbi:DEAD/DEAH box helicase [uncultured Hyphomonas sp.]|uniref:DEAD/DEAH box helicase n=1 Tax=uncultured Hyphomonas sp. TaxID=225298 RepID=UPI000C61129B|nr:DEAD/DEAH box helicase [Hyphomonadaceae bacterium]
MTQFTELGLAEPVLKAIAAEGYTKPTPIQEQAIPTLLEGRDLVGIAQTGTGKTAAFVLPLLSRLAANPGRPVSKTARILILAPTRELAAQIAESVRVYGSQMKLTTTIVVGGVKPGGQVRALARGVDVLVATPGRLLDHMETGAVKLSGTEAVVLDEADQMMDMGFLPAIRKVMKAIPTRRQTLLFSATMPKEIRSLANDFLNDPAEVTVATVSKPAEKIDQAVYMVKGDAKPRLLAELLSADDMDRAIVFTRTKHGADKVVRYLANEGLYAEAIHGNKSQNQRIRALDNFKKGKAPILVATDIAARGIDVDGVSHVVNMDMPNLPESYVHRIGRTARAGKSGIALSFVGNDERGYLRDIEKLIGRKIDRIELAEDMALDLSLPEEPGPHTKQSRGGGGGRGRGQGGGHRQGGQSQNRNRSGGGGGKGGYKGGGKPGGSRDGGDRSAARSESGGGGSRQGGGQKRRSKSTKSWSPVS